MKKIATYRKESWRADRGMHLSRSIINNIEWVCLKILCISSVTWGELIYGAEKSSNKASNLDQLEGFAASSLSDFTSN
ncbi:MAG: putative nucleic acid-binding protein [Candidatus Endobugula sp.]|jgi:predicted nucleic acid-binding protein